MADTRERTPLDDAEAELARILGEALRGGTKYRNPEGFIRWGLVERDIKEAYRQRLRSLAPGEARQEPDHAAMELLRKLAAEVGASGWHYEDGVLERCTVGGTADPAQAILLSFDSIDGQAKPRRFDSETNEAIRRLPTMLVTLCEDIQRIQDASREPPQQNEALAKIRAAAEAYEADPVDNRDRPSSWRRLQELLDAIHAAPQQKDGWRPIESAPKDGASVLLVDARTCWVGEGSWIVDHYDHGAWYEANNHPTDSWGKPIDATHWMPLPPAPREHEQNETERAE